MSTSNSIELHHYLEIQCRILQITTSASLTDIKLAYYKLAKQYHPDLSRDEDSEKEERFKDIQNAYESLVKNFTVLSLIQGESHQRSEARDQEADPDMEEFEREKQKWFEQQMRNCTDYKEHQSPDDFLRTGEYRYDEQEAKENKRYLINGFKWVGITLLVQGLYNLLRDDSRVLTKSYSGYFQNISI